MAATDQRDTPNAKTGPARFGAWVESACLAIAWNVGQKVKYWREEPYEVDAVIEGSWGKQAIEVKTARVIPFDLHGLLEFTKRYRAYRHLVLYEAIEVKNIQHMQIKAMPQQQFLLKNLPFIQNSDLTV